MVASTAQAARSKGGQFGPEYPGQFARNGMVNLQRNRWSTVSSWFYLSFLSDNTAIT